MQISLPKFVGFMIGVITVGLTAFFGYLMYTLFFTGESVIANPPITTINMTILGPKAQKAAAVLVNATDRIALKKKDIAFTESALFKSFTDIPDSVSLSESRGRPDPFVPYVAP